MDQERGAVWPLNHKRVVESRETHEFRLSSREVGRFEPQGTEGTERRKS